MNEPRIGTRVTLAPALLMGERFRGTIVAKSDVHVAAGGRGWKILLDEPARLFPTWWANRDEFEIEGDGS